MSINMIANTMQQDAFSSGKDARYFIAQAPGGSGKSLLQCLLGAKELEEGRKQLILIPQTQISKTFCGNGLPVTISMPDRAYNWQVAHNLCEGKRTGRGRRLKDFLLADTAKLPGCPTAISTHQALALTWQRLSQAERLQAIKNVTFRIDECHHIAGVFTESDLAIYGVHEQEKIRQQANRLGDFARFVFDHEGEGTRLHLSTATFYRGDRHAILSESVRDLFQQYYLPWDQHFPSLGIEQLYFNFFDFGADPLEKLLEQLREEPTSHHLVILPAHGCKFRTATFAPRLFQALASLFPAGRVLDLVTTATQAANKQLLQENPDQYHVVVACRLFNEGTDWVPCDRLENLDSCEQSLTLAVQRFFRPLRKCPGKTVVKINNYLPRFDPSLPAAQQREVLSDRFNALLTSVVTNGELVPTLVPRGRTKDEETLVPFQDLYSASDYHELMMELLRGYEALSDKSDLDEVHRLVDYLAEKYPGPDGVSQEAVKDALLGKILSLTEKHLQISLGQVRVDGVEVGSLRQEFDKIWPRKQRESLLEWGSSNIDAGVVKDLLRILDKPLDLEAIHLGIQEYYERTGKRLTAYDGLIPELGITARTLEGRLKRNHSSTISQECDKVIGRAESLRLDGLLAKTHAAIRQYAAGGVRLTKHHPMIPEFGITGIGLQHRLEKIGTTIAQEVDRVLGSDRAAEFSLEEIQAVIKLYLKKGKRLVSGHGPIPELGNLTGAALNARLKTKWNTTLAKERARLEKGR